MLGLMGYSATHWWSRDLYILKLKSLCRNGIKAMIIFHKAKNNDLCIYSWTILGDYHNKKVPMRTPCEKHS